MADEKITKPTGDVRMENNKREYSAIEIEVAESLLKRGYKWISRDEDDTLYAFKTKPRKGGHGWNYGGGVLLLVDENARGVIPIFDSVSWTDEDPVRLRDIVPQILTYEEREWLRTVVKPFRGRLKEVEVHGGAYYGRYITFAIAHPGKWGDDLTADYWPLPIPEGWFEGIRNYNKYTPEELEL